MTEPASGKADEGALGPNPPSDPQSTAKVAAETSLGPAAGAPELADQPQAPHIPEIDDLNASAGRQRSTSDAHGPPRGSATSFVQGWPIVASAVSAIVTTVFTGLLWSTTEKQIELTRTAADAAKASAEAAIQGNALNRQLFIGDQRPWVSLEVRLASDLVFSADDGWHIEISYFARNLGKTPAVGPDLHAGFVPFVIPRMVSPTGQHDPGTDVSVELKTLCKDGATAISRQNAAFSGQMLFPGEVREGRYGIYRKNHPAFVAARESPAYSGQFLLLEPISKSRNGS